MKPRKPKPHVSLREVASLHRRASRMKKPGQAPESLRMLDEALGMRFAVLVLGNADEPVLQSAEALAAQLGGVCLRVLPVARPVETRTGDVVDLEGKLFAWFSLHEADAVVVRPDRYVYGASRGSGIERFREELRRFVHLPPVARRDQAPAKALLSSGT